MDFRNLCQHIDMDSIRAKIPPLPSMPALPQIRLPKSIPKLRSRRIFRTSRDDVRPTSPKQQQQNATTSQLPSSQSQTAPFAPPSVFINHSPRRISTISSLMNQSGDRHQSTTYRSACSIDDDYPSPRYYDPQRSKPISPVRAPETGPEDGHNAGANSKLSLTEKLQKGYKDLSEFKLKHIFAKKTVVRIDNIEVDHYVQRYNEDLMREREEQERRDRRIAENYRFNFKVSRQNTGHTNSISSNESPTGQAKPKSRNVKSVADCSGDESGMEATPPARKDGIAATRFTKVKKPPFRRSMSEESYKDENNEIPDEQEHEPDLEPNKSALWAIKKIQKLEADDSPAIQEKAANTNKSGSYKDNLRRLKSYVSPNEGKRDNENADVSQEKKKRKAPLTPQQSQEGEEVYSTPDKTFSTLKHNLKRIQKSIKRPQASSTNESGEDEPPHKEETKSTLSSKTEKLANRLRRFKSRESSIDDLDKTSPKKDEQTHGSPIRTVITNKLQTWKKSFKKRSNEPEATTNTGDEMSSPEKQKRSDTFIKKLKYIRSRKDPNATADERSGNTDDENAASTSKSSLRKATTNLEERFEQARQRTIKKVNDKMQQIKFFQKPQGQGDKADNTKREQKSTRSTDDESEEAEAETSNVPPTIGRRRHHRRDSFHNSDQEDFEEGPNNSHSEYSTQMARTSWTTKNLLSDSMDSETDSEFPRVLIHQDNSDTFESTLIIAVTRPALPSISSTPKIVEIPPENSISTPTSSKSLEWIPNKEIISGFLEITPPTRRRKSLNTILSPPRGHTRTASMESNSDSDSWIPENLHSKQLSNSNGSSRYTSTVALKSIDENEEPWRIHTTLNEDRLYKRKSIDIFEVNMKQGGASAAFEDFDDQLRNEPIVKIQQTNVDSFEKESSEELDAPDDDNSSRITKILVKVQKVEVAEVNEQIEIEVPKKEEGISSQQITNSCESLVANFDTSEELNFDSDEDRPPSAAPSPPPCHSPPPPPLPERKSSTRPDRATTTDVVATQPIPPLPKSKPPLPTTKPPLPITKPPISTNSPPPPRPPAPLATSKSTPPRIPERTASMTRLAKPLVKTSSLRLAYNEQVKPTDIGKVNKLISRFEQPQPKIVERPRIIPRPRRMLRNDTDDFSDDEEEETDNDDDEDDNKTPKTKYERETTPTPTNTPRTNSLDSSDGAKTTNGNEKTTTNQMYQTIPVVNVINTQYEEINWTADAFPNTSHGKSATLNVGKPQLNLDRNSNYSQPGSEYGSPLEYPSSLMGSTETTPIPERKTHEFRGSERSSRRSMTRDDERFLSFDSDEENSYYSISSSGSSRYIVEI